MWREENLITAAIVESDLGSVCEEVRKRKKVGKWKTTSQGKLGVCVYLVGKIKRFLGWSDLRVAATSFSLVKKEKTTKEKKTAR